MKKVLATLAVLAIVASPAFAAVQNVKVSGDIDTTYVNRNHFGLGKEKHLNHDIETGLVKQSDILTQTRLRVDADLSDNVSTTVGLINERAWDAENNASENSTSGTNADQNTNVQLYLANVTLREFLYSPLTLTVGRQILSFGNGLILGDGGVNNLATGNLTTVAADLTKRSTYDAVRATLDYKPLTLDLAFVRNSSNATNGGALSNASDNDDVYVLNANYQLGDAANTVVEAYTFTRRNTTTFNSNNRGDTTYVPGLRVSTNPVKGLNVGAEVAGQLGNITTNSSGAKDTARRQALATQFTGSYELPALEQYKPVAFGSYTYVSGDKNRDLASTNDPQRSGETYSAWDPLFETQGSGTIYNTLFDLTNMHILSAGVSAKPLEDVTAKATWSGLYADKKYGSLNALTFRQPDGSSTSNVVTTGRKAMGNEYDLAVDYAYTEDVLFGVNLGWFVPGTTFDGKNDTTASQALAHVLVNF